MDEKQQKKIVANKLPRNLKKSYTKAQLEKKLLSKIYIPKDRDFVILQFVEDKDYSEKLAKKAVELASKGKVAKLRPEKLHIPLRTEYEKKDFNRLKSIGVQIAKQKGRIRFIPLAACAVFIVGIMLFVTIAKDPLAKSAIIQGLQTMAGAKAELSSVNIDIFDSRITIHGMTVANKNEPMTNAFEATKLEIDFDLLQLLKGRFVSENIEVSGMAFGTERQTSGELPRTVELEPQEESEFVKNINAKKSDALAHTKSNIIDAFAILNPQTILNDTLAQLEIAEVAQTAQIEVERIVSVWESRPEEIETSITSFAKNTQKVIERDYQSIENISDIQASIVDLTTAIEDGIELSKTIETIVNDLQNESKLVQNMVQTTIDAIEHDTNFVSTEINKISSFTIDDGVDYISDSLQSAVLNTLGTYYPHVENILALVKKSQANTVQEKAEERQKKSRMAGRTIEYTRDIYPSFLIERIFASGTGFESSIVDISNNPDKWGKPAFLIGSLEESAVGGANRIHTAEIVVDARTNTDAPLVFVEYGGSGYALSLDAASIADVPGIPSLTSNSAITGTIAANWDGSFTIGAALDMRDVLMQTIAFEPNFAYKIYQNALNSIQTMSLAVQADFDPTTGIELDLKTDVDTQFLNALKIGINQELAEIKKQLEAEITVKLKEYTLSFNERLAEFRKIENRIYEQKQKLAALQTQLEQRKVVAQKRIEDTLNVAIDEAKDKVTEQIEEAVEETKEEVKDRATDALKGLFGR